LAKESTEQKAFREIIRLILSHKYSPGSPLIEKQIAEELGMSRTPVRGALRQLVAIGLLDNSTKRNGSCIIPVLSRKDLEKLNEARLLLEPRVAYEAALNADPEKYEKFKALLEEEKHCYCTGDMDIYEINEELHFGIAAMADNPYLERCIKQVFWRTQLYVFFFDTFYMDSCNRGQIMDPELSIGHREHAGIIDAIFCRNGEKAETLMKEHVLSTFNMLTANAGFRYFLGGSKQRL
jgi:DNA-binding GntR family transcriptional regulator